MGRVHSKIDSAEKYALTFAFNHQHEQLVENPTVELGTSAHPKMSAKTASKLLKIKSSSNLQKISPTDGGAKKIRVSRSSNALSLAKLSGKEVQKCRITCSPTYPWLIKDAYNFENLSLNDFEFGRVLGAGLMGTASIAKSKNEHKYLVFKSISKKDIVKHDYERHVKNERLIMSTLASPFCVKLFGAFQDKNYIYFAMQYVPGGELFQRLEKSKKFTPDVAKFYVSEIFLALEHVQSFGFCYRDLKPENVLIDECGHVKLADFGFSTVVNKATGKMHTMCGTPAYLSPEQLDGKLSNGYTSVVDWWSLGILTYELLTGKTPFCKDENYSNHYAIYLRILTKRISFPMLFDSKAKQLISALCHDKVESRLCTTDCIRKHTYFTLPWEVVENRMLIPPFIPTLEKVGDIHYCNIKNSPMDAMRAPKVGIGYPFINEFFDF